MSQLLTKIAALKLDKRGVTALEYGLIAALIAVVIIGGVTALGNNLSSTFHTVSDQLQNNASGNRTN
jgi:pilus assembly protein Flp/PilA